MRLKLKDLPSEAALARELVRRGGLYSFLQETWEIFEPSAEFSGNWHLGLMCEALEAVSRRQIDSLVINVPPGCTKSSLVSVAWPAWQWTFDPGHRWMNISADSGLVLRDANKLIEIVQSDLYRQAWPEGARLKHKAPAAGDFWTTEGGQRFSTSVGGRAIGQHAHTQVWDDPIKPADLMTNAEDALAKCHQAFTGTFSTRKADANNFARVLIMQRLAEGDLAGLLLDQGWEHICFPMNYVPNCSWDMGNSLKIQDPRTNAGDLLWPERYSAQSVSTLEKDLGNDASAQLQQNPTPATGGVVEEAWLQLEWTELPSQVTYYQSWDFSASGKNPKVNSRVSGALWGVGKISKGRRLCTSLEKVQKGVKPEYEDVEFPSRICYFLIDEVVGHMNYPESKKAFLTAQQKPQWHKAATRIVERKANGIALIDELSAHYAIKEVNPSDSKESRFIVESAKFEGGLVLFPTSGQLASTFDFRSELVKFPRGVYDDRIDTTSQFLSHVGDRLERYREAMRIGANEARRRRR